MDTETMTSKDKNSMLYWFPKIAGLEGVPQPKTTLIKTEESWREMLLVAEGTAELRNFCAIEAICNQFGFPVFIRTDKMAAKHSWKHTCFVEKPEDLQEHIANLVERTLNCDMIGKMVEGIVVREYIEMESPFTAFDGLPISRERRYFVRNGKVECHHPYWCFDKETEVLTENGFKLFKDLSGDELIFTLSPSLKIELLMPMKKIAFHYKGDMIHLLSRSFDMLMTPDHKVPVLQEDSSISLVKARDLTYHNRIPRTGRWAGEDLRYVEIGCLKFDSSDFFEFFGYYLSEGSCNRTDHGKSFRISIWQRECTQGPILACLDRLGIDYKVYGNHICNRIYIYRKKWKDLFEFLYCFGKSYQKYIPRELKSFAPVHLRKFLDAFLFGDGTVHESRNPRIVSKQNVYYTSSKKLADDLAELILKVGKRPSIYQRHKKRLFTVQGATYRTKHPVFTVTECNSRPFHYAHPSVLANKMERKTFVNYDDMVYCVAMPKNHIIYVKRNGKCSWSGNCEDAIEFMSIDDGFVKPPSDWKDFLSRMNYESFDEIETLTGYAKKIAAHLDGYWSIDFCRSRPTRTCGGAWYFIDCALGKDSWHPGCCSRIPLTWKGGEIDVD